MTNIHLEEGEIDLALKTVKQVKSSIYYGGEQLTRVAQAASATHPHEALDIYQQHVESLIEAHGRDNYQRACELLLKAREIYYRLSEELKWAGFMSELRERHRRLPALTEELANAGL